MGGIIVAMTAISNFTSREEFLAAETKNLEYQNIKTMQETFHIELDPTFTTHTTNFLLE